MPSTLIPWSHWKLHGAYLNGYAILGCNMHGKGNLYWNVVNMAWKCSFSNYNSYDGSTKTTHNWADVKHSIKINFRETIFAKAKLWKLYSQIRWWLWDMKLSWLFKLSHWHDNQSTDDWWLFCAITFASGCVVFEFKHISTLTENENRKLGLNFSEPLLVLVKIHLIIESEKFLKTHSRLH